MCNLYSVTTNQKAIRQLFAVAHDLTGNLPPLPAIFPDQLAPVVQGDGADRRLEMMRWGMPGPPQFGGRAITKSRSTRNQGHCHQSRGA